MIRDWISNFHREYMVPAEEHLTDLQREIFEVQWSDTRSKLGPDIEGSMTKSILESGNILSGKGVSKHTDTEMAERKDKVTAAEHLKSSKEGRGNAREGNFGDF